MYLRTALKQISRVALTCCLLYIQNAHAADLNITIFGGNGDLAMRKLYPAIYNLEINNLIPRSTQLTAISFTKFSTEEFRAVVTKSFESNRIDCSATSACERFINNLTYISGDLTTDAPYVALKKQLNPQESTTRIFFLATSFKLFTTITEHLGNNHLVNKNSRIVVEKPLGDSLKSSQEIHAVLAKYFDENQIYRIDHYLAKPLVQSILDLRFDNPIMTDVWNKDHIKNIEINAFESLGVEQRAGYYDQVGALKDMVDSHLLQLLTLMTMEEPKDTSPDAIRAAKVATLRQLRPIQEKNFLESITLGQYQGYQNEPGVSKNSTTDTYASIKLYIDSPRWKDVPFYITTGKKLSKKITEIIVNFKANKAGFHNELYLEIDPSISIKLNFNLRNPDTKNKTEAIWLSTDKNSNISHWKLKDYDKLIYDTVQGDHSLFVSRSEVEASWKWVDNIIHLKQLKHIVPKQYSFDKKENALKFFNGNNR